MCTVPSWITVTDAKTKKETILFLTDADARRHKIPLYDATGHAGIRSVYRGVSGEDGEGLHDKTPKVVKAAIMAGKLNKIASVGDIDVVFGRWALPFPGVENIEVRREATAIFPRLRYCGDIAVGAGASFVAPALVAFDDIHFVGGCAIQIGKPRK